MCDVVVVFVDEIDVVCGVVFVGCVEFVCGCVDGVFVGCDFEFGVWVGDECVVFE